MRHRILLLLLLGSFTAGAQQPHSHQTGRPIRFPSFGGFTTLVCDFHQHTVFSDGSVWPDIRIKEALMDGLDAISLTEHLEYQPHKEDIPHPDRNRSYQLALKEAKDHGLVVVNGSEITRRMPPGHNNAIFLSDANKMLVADSVEVFREARKQGAFIFWNHPNWTAQRRDGMATITDMHRMLIRDKLLDGIEVVNDQTYSDEALQLALDHQLTIMSNSDVHQLVDWDFKVPQGGHRPVTLVFAREKTESSIREALFERRTVAYYRDLLIGRDEYLLPLLQASVRIKEARYPAKSDVLTVIIENLTPSPVTLLNRTGLTFHNNADIIVLKPGESNELLVKTLQRVTDLTLRFEVLSAINAPKRHPEIRLAVQVQ
ncbi:MAG: hypothetical protein RJA57_1058 [Bacteroidota bacterium]